MTCNACIHFFDCLVDGKTRYYGPELAHNCVEQCCKFFKDELDYIKPKHGCWIPNDMERTENDYYNGIRTLTISRLTPLNYRCSECGRIEEYKEPYCNCGAQMDLEECVINDN